VTPEVAQRLWREAKAAVAGKARQRGEATSVPVERYRDPARAAAELALLRRHPIAVAPSASLAAPGDWLSTRVHGVPLLLARDRAGALHAHLNVCRHRGAIVAPEETAGTGKARFVCPYHAWTYDAGGRQIGRPWPDEFPQVACAEDADLVPVPVAERLGLVWVVPTGRLAFDWSAWFGPFGDELAGLGYDARAASPHARRFAQASNWKLVLEGNLETYHFQYAHRTTIAGLFHDNVIVHAQAGDHQRIVLPKRSIAEADVADDRVDGALLGRHANVIWFFFPCTFLLWEGDHVDGFSVSPTGPEACDVRGWMVVPERFAGKPAAHWAENHRIFWAALDEDFALAASIQSGLASGANAALRYGTSEFACQAFRRSVDGG
jgi:choline monooxygenase